MVNKEKVEQLKTLLKELFQFQNNDLDFGIYRIMNIKKKEISEFIDNELFEIVKKELEIPNIEFNLDELKLLEKEIKKDFGCDMKEAIRRYSETPKVKEYFSVKNRLNDRVKEQNFEGEIYDHIINFFSRYYEDGDFISKKRYSKDNKYSIPYNGEEVYLHWVNKDQYYIKTGENFKDYSFKIDDLKVEFKVLEDK